MTILKIDGYEIMEQEVRDAAPRNDSVKHDPHPQQSTDEHKSLFDRARAISYRARIHKRYRSTGSIL